MSLENGSKFKVLKFRKWINDLKIYWAVPIWLAPRMVLGTQKRRIKCTDTEPMIIGGMVVRPSIEEGEHN